MKTRLTIHEVAVLMGASEQFVRVSLQRGLLPIGYAFKQSSEYTYYVNAVQFSQYTGLSMETIEMECEKMRTKSEYKTSI